MYGNPGLSLHKHRMQKIVPSTTHVIHRIFDQSRIRTPHVTKDPPLNIHRKMIRHGQTCNIADGRRLGVQVLGTRLEARQIHSVVHLIVHGIDRGGTKGHGHADRRVEAVQGMQGDHHGFAAPRIQGGHLDLVVESTELEVDRRLGVEVGHHHAKVGSAILGVGVQVVDDGLDRLRTKSLLNKHRQFHIMLDIHHLDIRLVVFEDEDVVAEEAQWIGIPVEVLGLLVDDHAGLHFW